jgi:hypothetical protein
MTAVLLSRGKRFTSRSLGCDGAILQSGCAVLRQAV